MSEPFFVAIALSLRQADSLVRANSGARTTLCAEFGVDLVDVALGNCLNGALTDACSTCDAVFTNYVSHSLSLLKLFVNAKFHSLLPNIRWCKGTFFFLYT